MPPHHSYSRPFNLHLDFWKSRSVSNLRKISGPANLDFFLGLHLEKKLGLYYKYEKNPGDKLKKNPGLQDLDLDFQKSRCRLKGWVYFSAFIIHNFIKQNLILETYKKWEPELRLIGLDDKANKKVIKCIFGS